MVSIYDIKPRFQQLLQPVLSGLYQYNVRPNVITGAALVLSFGIGVAFWWGAYYPMLFLVVPIGLIIRMALNALDGMMAKQYNLQSQLGEVLNEMGDVVSDLFIYFPLLLHESHNLYLVVIFLCLCIISEMAGVLTKAITGQRTYHGPMGKSDRAFVIGAFSLLLFLEVPVNEYTRYGWIVINGLLLVSTYFRLQKAVR